MLFPKKPKDEPSMFVTDEPGRPMVVSALKVPVIVRLFSGASYDLYAA